MQRRSVLKAGLVLISTATAAAIFRPVGAAVRVLQGGSKWLATETPPPVPVDARVRAYLSDREMAQLKAIFDRLIPADELGMSASEAGCLVFIDHQLAGPYGQGATKYLAGPEATGSAAQGDQSLQTPAQFYRQGLAELDAHVRKAHGMAFEAMTPARQDAYLEQMEAGKLAYPSVNPEQLFRQLLANVQEGYFADPVYGGNKDMVGWKMIGFPGARYDYRDFVQQKNQVLNIIPISIAGRI